MSRRRHKGDSWLIQPWSEGSDPEANGVGTEGTAEAPRRDSPPPAGQSSPLRWAVRVLILGTLLGLAMFATYLIAVALTAPEFPR